MKEALFYAKLEGGKVRCELCPHRCIIGEGKTGVCGVRQNKGGVLYSLVYGKAIAVHVDPIEKKPLFHVYPGSRSFSLATVGCNFSCRFCQNADISQMPRNTGHVAGEDLPPDEVVAAALRHHCRTIAYTYTEPTVFYEYAEACAQGAVAHGIKNVFVTNGFICEEPLRRLQGVLHAANVDLKGFDEQFYRKVVGGRLDSVLQTLRLMKELGMWVEVTTLLVPTHVDQEDQLRAIARFIVEELGKETPWHVTRFYPQYRLTDLPPTPLASLHRARQIGLEAGLHYVYSGNVPSDEGEHTYCYKCGATVIERHGFSVRQVRLREGACAHCGAPIHGIGLP
ncbi:MAG: AmmeMemoRadiSam system radical SAM enzyme [bacterium]|jgi:pyruvate formate lyase activating enzyme|nr:AmmeMemoRadiSam system radical SAM enzyme [candidate division KSB1 bacterium]MDH7559658.1 AmmeMemoRadiSam system radical SAM enzyme [bacterium]